MPIEPGNLKDLPEAAVARLTENAARQGTSRHIFTSNLSPGELLLNAECGYEPLGQVMGCCVYQVGWQSLTESRGHNGLQRSSMELETVSRAYTEARDLCFSRLEGEATILKADGIVGVRFERTTSDLPEGIFEIKAIGTAVRSKRAEPDVVGHRPFISNLTGQDHWSLRQSGIKPVGFAFGNCSWYQISTWSVQAVKAKRPFNRGSKSQTRGELIDCTQGVYAARKIAVDRLRTAAKGFGAKGVVGVVVETLIEPMEHQVGFAKIQDLFVQFTIFGTAIAYEMGVTPHIDVRLTVPLTD